MNDYPRKVSSVVKPIMVTEGAGVRLKRSIAIRSLDYLDPFLLFDHFGSDNPADYIAGFPMHPHRGIETVTYMLAGIVCHRESIGNSGEIGGGDVQWMTSGRGILHEEMPQPRDGKMEGFQLWVNLPARLKMTQPRCQEIPSAQIPENTRLNGVKIRLIAGKVDENNGPVTEIATNPSYLDIFLPPDTVFTHPIEKGHTAFGYIFEGEGVFGIGDDEEGTTAAHPALVIFDDGDYLQVRTQHTPARFLLASGKPLNEPIARYGPFVMNTAEEIEHTLHELREGTFIR